MGILFPPIILWSCTFCIFCNIICLLVLAWQSIIKLKLKLKTIQFREWVVLLPLPFIPDFPLSPFMAVKRVIAGVVLLPLPFIPDSPQFALLQQLIGLSALYRSGIAWLPGFRLSSLSRFSPRAFLLSQVFEKGWVLFSLPLGPRPKIMLATSSVGECAPLSFSPGFLSNLLKCLGTGIGMLCYFTLRCLFPLDCNLFIPLLQSILTTNISTPQPTQFGFGV